MWLLAAFVIVPLVEIGLFIQVGGWLGLWPTLAIVIATALAGTWLVRSQGLAQLAALREGLSGRGDPVGPLAHGAMILVSGTLLLTPGFFTDGLGFALLVPAVRRALIAALKARVAEAARQQARAQAERAATRRADAITPAGGDVVDGTAEEVRIAPRDPARPPSGWSDPRG
ncbi:MAG: FxsA family protein [Paracoccaceae bacterium]